MRVQWWQGFLDLIWPPDLTCQLCDTEGGGPLCSACEERCLVEVAVSRCDVCTRPLGRIGHGGTRAPQPAHTRCVYCRAGQPFDQVVSVGIHQGALRSAIHRLKYRGRRKLAEGLGLMLAERMRPFPGEMLIPVPLHRAREAERGYNQAGLIATAAGAALGRPALGGWVSRERSTGEQARLGRAERLANMAGVFAVARRGRPPWVGRAAWIVDDVLTTGATVGALATLLRETGAASVSVAVLAVSGSRTDV